MLYSVFYQKITSEKEEFFRENVKWMPKAKKKRKKPTLLFLKFTLHRNASSLDADPTRAFLFVSE